MTKKQTKIKLPKGYKFDSYILSNENGFNKVTHESGNWSIRLHEGLSPRFDQKAREELEMPTVGKVTALGFLFTAISAFIQFALNQATYLHDWLLWHNEWVNSQKPQENLTDEEMKEMQEFEEKGKS